LDAEQAAKEKRAATKSAKTSRPTIPEKKISWADFKATQQTAQLSASDSNSPVDASDS
jgi:hypothetical protein